jgi:hypothetical protein
MPTTDYDELAYLYADALTHVTPDDMEWDSWLAAVSNIVRSAAGFPPDLLDALYDEYLAGRTSRQAAIDVLIGGVLDDQ